MIEYDGFIYLDVYRTGSTLVLKRIAEATGRKPLRFHRHASVSRGRPLAVLSRKPAFVAVRNPWDWYVSLWAFGAGGNSAIRRYLAAILTEAEIASLYDWRRPAPSFRHWMRIIHDPSKLDRFMAEHMPQSGLSPLMGLYSYRFLRVATYYPRLLLRKPFVGSAAGHLQRFKSYGEVLRTETLDDDLDSLFLKLSLPVKPRPTRTMNASERTLASYRDYYDDETRDLVARRDRLFSEIFGYSF
jgi:hypothetical protein